MKRRIEKLSTHKERRLKHKEIWRLSVDRAVREGNAWIASQIASIEACGGRKEWSDPLIDAANKPKPEKELSKKEKKEWLPERKLRAYLKTIARLKHKMIPRKILNDLERVHQRTRFSWFPASFEDDSLTSGAHLFSYGMSFSRFDDYLSELTFRLRNPVWVAALRECAGCRKLLLSFTRWKNKFCSVECQPARKRISARKTRRHTKEENTGNQAREVYKSAELELRCRKCGYRESKGKLDDYIETYSEPIGCPNCGNRVKLLHITKTWNEDEKDWAETEYAVYDWEARVKKERGN